MFAGTPRAYTGDMFAGRPRAYTGDMFADTPRAPTGDRFAGTKRVQMFVYHKQHVRDRGIETYAPSVHESRSQSRTFCVRCLFTIIKGRLDANRHRRKFSFLQKMSEFCKSVLELPAAMSGKSPSVRMTHTRGVHGLDISATVTSRATNQCHLTHDVTNEEISIATCQRF